MSIPRNRRKRPPPDWPLISEQIDSFSQQMRTIETTPTESKRKVEALWPIFQLTHQRSKYIYNLYYKKKEISKELYDYCLREKHADAALVAKWKKPGYEKLCCLLCIQNSNHNFRTTCICRVPKDKLEDDRRFECKHCGCRGCASGS